MKIDVSNSKYILLNDYLPFADGDRESIFSVLKFISESDNIGNIVFLDAINHFLGGVRNISTFGFIRESTSLDKNSTIILALANFISNTWTAPKGFIEALSKFRIVLFSVGLQQPLNSDENFQLSPDARSVLDMAKQSGGIIGARGKLTQKFLSAQGFDSIAIGCPSVYLKTQERIEFKRKENPLICASNTMLGDHRDIAIKMNAFAVEHCKGYMIQTEAGILADIMNLPDAVVEFIAQNSGNPHHAGLLREKYFDYGFYNDNPQNWEAYRRWFLQYARISFRPEFWRQYTSMFDFTFGTRFHGSIIALQSGVTPLIVPIDARVQEMVDFHKLPCLPYDQFKKISHPEEIFEHVSLDAHFDDIENQKAEFKKFLKELG